MEQKRKLTRREFARGVAIGAAGLIMANAEPAHSADPAAPVGEPTSPEGEALVKAVAANVGYPLTETQTTEVRSVLQNYPGEFGKVRSFAIPDDVLPASISTAPASSGWKGAKK